MAGWRVEHPADLDGDGYADGEVPTWDDGGGVFVPGSGGGGGGASALDDLTDVDLTGATTGDGLVRNSSGIWVPVALAGGDVPAGGSAGQVLTKQSGTDFDTDWETPSSGGGGGLIAETLVTGSAASDLTLTWGADHRRLRLTAWVRSNTAVAVSADSLFVQLGDATTLDAGSTSYSYSFKDFTGNAQASAGDSKMWGNRLAVVAADSNELIFTRVDLEFHDADQTVDPVRMRVASHYDGAPLAAARRPFGWGKWKAPTGPVRQIKLTLQAGSFVVDSEAYVEALA